MYKKLSTSFIVGLILISNPVSAVSIGSISDPLISEQYYIQRHRINDAWEFSKGSPNVVVAVIDDGVYLNHPDLTDAIWINKREVLGDGIDNDNNGYVDDYWGWNFIDNNPELTTKGVHGTMVAGIIAAQHNGLGIAGIAPDSKIMPLIACTNTECPQEAVIKAIKYAADNGASIINLSLGKEGTYSYLSGAFDQIIDYANLRNVLIIAAAGNGDIETGLGKDTTKFPVSPVCNGKKQQVIGVGATTRGTHSLAIWSNYGQCVEVSASGEDIVTTAPLSQDNIQYYYVSSSGTSFSAPIVAGVAALIRSVDRISNADVISLVVRWSGQQGLQNSSLAIDAYEAVAIATSTPDIIRVEPMITKQGQIIDVYGSRLNNQSVHFTFMGESYALVPTKDVSIIDSKHVTLRVPANMPSGKYYLDANGVRLDDQIQIGDVVIPPSVPAPSPAPTPIPIVPVSATPTVNQNDWEKQESALFTKVDSSLVSRVKGKILLQVQEHGEAWYIDPVTLKKYYMKDGQTAYSMMRSFGVGITDKDLAKIPTQKGMAGIDLALTNRMKGKILLQVQQHGEAWYVNPSDGLRYYLKDGTAAYEIMRKLGMGITNIDLRKIQVGVFVPK